MSVQKIIAEADKLLERGKLSEAIEKLKLALADEPMNQLATTKLANAYAASGSNEKAAATFVALGQRLSDAGKSQVAIAVYKQALEFTPNDIALKLRFAEECEGVGKVGDAHTHAQGVFQYYLRRKKYFDAANILPMLVRLNGKDERLKQVWLEVMQLSQAEKKLVHLLVAFGGPPGIVSEEFKVGGEPTGLSASLYEGLKNLVQFFPRDPKVAYAVAWCAYRRGRLRDFFHFLRECLRREPDFCLALLLFARVLAEREKLNESYFVFRFLKERLASDKSAADISTLNQLVDGFVEKNGWITFAEQTGDLLERSQFLEAVRGAPASAEKAAPPPVPTKVGGPAEPPGVVIPPSLPQKPKVATVIDLGVNAGPAPGEIELGLGEEEMEIEHHSETRVTTVRPRVENPPPPTGDAQIAEQAATTEGTVVAPLEALEATQIAPMAEEHQAPPPPPAMPSAPVEPESPPAAGGFDPMAHAMLPEPAEENAGSDRTEIFSPMEIIAASQRGAGPAHVATKIIETEPLPEAAPPASQSRTIEPEAPAGAWSDLDLNGQGTELFSPMEMLKAQSESRTGAAIEGLAISNEPLAAEDAVSANGATMILQSPVSAPASEESLGPGLVPIPSAGSSPELAAESESGEPDVDLGEDLLDGATRILIAPPSANATQHLLKEIRQEMGKKEEATNSPSLLLRKAERFIAKRNYYLARKALRHALALGANEEQVKNRLADIRKLERPESLYHAVSNDAGEAERSSDILERLEREFDIGGAEEGDAEIQSSIEGKLEEIFRASDPRTVLDFGIGLHEMGLFRQAEQLFSRMVSEYPDWSFDAYYLAAVAKFSRKDYAGAASILKKLSTDADRSEQDKIQVYYALGELFAKMSQRDRSQEFFRKVAELDANYRNVRHKLEE